MPSTIKNKETQEIGKHLRIARIQRNMTQSDLAQALGVSRQSIFAAEKGTISLRADACVKACKILNIDANWLLGTEPMGFMTDDGDVMYHATRVSLAAKEKYTQTNYNTVFLS